MSKVFQQHEKTNAVYEKNLMHWLYLQLCLYKEKCCVNGYIRAWAYDIGERIVEDEYKFNDEIYRIRIWKKNFSKPYDRYRLYLFIAPYCFQKCFSKITDKEFEILHGIESKLATYINIVHKQGNEIFKQRPFTLGDCVAIIQEILCIGINDKINYDYFGHHNSSSISLKRCLEKGHGKPLYIIPELILYRKYIRGKFLIHKDYGEVTYMIVDAMFKLVYLMLWDIFRNKNYDDVLERFEVHKDYLEKI